VYWQQNGKITVPFFSASRRSQSDPQRDVFHCETPLEDASWKRGGYMSCGGRMLILLSCGGHDMRCQQQLEGYLREHQIPYQIQHHPVAFTAQQIAD